MPSAWYSASAYKLRSDTPTRVASVDEIEAVSVSNATALLLGLIEA
jgi:hypothetical protein